MASSRKKDVVYVYSLEGNRVGKGTVESVSQQFGVPTKSIYAVGDGRRGAANGYMFSWDPEEALPKHKSLVQHEVGDCTVPGCGKKCRSSGATYCEKHYGHMRYHGRILTRTPTEHNNYVIHGDYVEVYLYGEDPETPVNSFYIDTTDLDKVMEYVWGHIKKAGYVLTRPNGGTMYLHRYLMDCTDPDLVVDHINGNPLDNRRSNLRVTTPQGNARNKHNNPKNYYYNSARGAWCVNISIDNRTVYLGGYATEEEAMTASQEARKKYYLIEEF